MKKIIIILCAMALTYNSYAQDKGEWFRFGLKAGINRSTVYDESGDNFVADDKLGFVGGGFLKIAITDHVGFQPEFIFAQKGFKARGNYGLNSYEFTRTTNFFEVPLLLEVKANKHFSLLMGPQYSYLLSTRDEFRNSTISITDEDRISNDNFRKNLLALAIGFDVNVENVVLSGRAGWDILRNNGDGTSSNPRYKNHWLQVTVGYIF